MCEQPEPVNFLPNAQLLCWRLLSFLSWKTLMSPALCSIFCSTWCMWGTVFFRISHLSSPTALSWLWFSGWCIKICNITDHLLLPFPAASVQAASSCAGQKTGLWGLRFLLALQIENDDQPGCLRDALRKSIKDSASRIVFLADGGHPATWAVEFRKISACCPCSLPSPCEERYAFCVQNLKSFINISRSPLQSRLMVWLPFQHLPN